MLEVYALQIPKEMSPQGFLKLLTYVSIEKRVRIKHFRKRDDSLRALFSDLLIRSIILERYGVSNQEITFKYNAYGKPFLAFDTSFSFNISHSGSWVVAIVGNQQLVGIDIEEIRPIDIEIARRFFSPVEYAELIAKGEKERLPYFYDLWSLKESFVKAIGRGLSVPLNSFAIQRKGMLEQFSICQNYSPQSFYFRQYDIDTSYKLSACATINWFPESISKYNIYDIYRWIL